MQNPTRTFNFKLKDDQFLSSIKDQLPKEPGIHFINAGTGVGKTTLMLEMAHENLGEVVFPVKAIKAQQEYYKAAKELHSATITQLEKLAGDTRNQLHIDEIQISFTGDYRELVERMIHIIRDLSKKIPIYIYSGSILDNLIQLIPFNLNTITKIEKKFERELKILHIKSNAKIKQSTMWIATALSEIKKSEQKPILAFVNSFGRACNIRDRLANEKKSFIVLDSKRTRLREDGTPYDEEAYRVYKLITEEQSLDSIGYDGVIATKCLAEGIDINSDICVVSLQNEAGVIFQEQGRIRAKGSHWLITGNGEERLWISQNKLWRSYEDTQFEITESESEIIEKTCKWVDEEARKKAILYSMYADEAQKGLYAYQTIRDLQELGYKTVEQYEISERVEQRITGGFIKKSAMLEAVIEYDCPTFVNEVHPVYKHLLETYSMEQLEPMEQLCNWKKNWLSMDLKNFKVDCWGTYRRINQHGRNLFVKMFGTGDMTFFESRYESMKAMHEFLAETKKVVKSEVGVGYIKAEKVEELSEAFWPTVLDQNKTVEWFDESNLKTRTTSFKIIMGMQPSANDQWHMPSDKAWWDVPLSNSEGNKFRARAKHIDDIDAFCNHHTVDKKIIAGMKPKDIKKMNSEITW